MAPLTSTIIGLVRDMVRAESDSDVPVIADSFLIKAVSDANLEWLRAFRKSGGNTDIVMTRDTGYNLIDDTDLAEDTTTATTDFDVDDSSDFESSGALVIWDQNMPDVIYYTGNTSNNFSVNS